MRIAPGAGPVFRNRAVVQSVLQTPDSYFGADQLIWLDARQNVTTAAYASETIATVWNEHDSSNSIRTWSTLSSARSPQYLPSDGGSPSISFRYGGSFAQSWFTGDTAMPIEQSMTVWALHNTPSDGRAHVVLSGQAGGAWEWRNRGLPSANDAVGFAADGGANVLSGHAVPSDVWALYKWSFDAATGDWHISVDDSSDSVKNNAMTITVADVVEEVSHKNFGGGKELRGKLKFLFAAKGLIADADAEHQYMLDYVASQWPTLVTY